MSARSLADARNRELINAALRENPLIIKAQQSGQLTGDIATKIGLNVSSKAPTNIVQSTLGKSGLGAKAIAAAQALSEKFGIVTFDVSGNIATIPETREIDTSINVGFGRFTESAFKKSVETLQGKVDPITSFGNSVNETILKPLIKGFEDLFVNRRIEDLPAEQQIRVKDIDAMLEILEAQLKIVPSCSSTGIFASVGGGRQSQTGTIVNCSAHDEAIAFNKTISAQIEILEAEREGIFKFYVITAGFEKKVIDQAEILTRLVKENPLTATLKAQINAEIEKASALLQEIITKQIEVTNQSMTTLHLAMNAGAARISEQISGASALDQLGTNLLDNLSGVGGLLDDLGGLFDGIGKEFAKSLEFIFNPSPTNLKRKEAEMLEYRATEYAKFIEESQAFLARGKKQ